jgi:hypothetical protein
MNTNFIAGVPDVVGARSDRIRRRTSSHVNEVIDHETHDKMESAIAGGRDAIIERLHKLDRELDVERALLGFFGSVGGLSLAFGSRRTWKRVLRTQALFSVMQALVGWCPPVVVLRRVGFRTAREIAAERAALVEKLAGWT